MSVPGVFPPVEVDGRILGDGGLVNNLPIDVARSLGADKLIVVNIGTPLAPRSSLGTLVGVTTQMISILTEQNVNRSLAQLNRDKDILLSPNLGELTAADFKRAPELIALGEEQAQAMAPALRRLALPPADWQAYRAGLRKIDPALAPVASVRFEGPIDTHPQRLLAHLGTQPGQAFRVDAAEQDTQALAATDDYERTDYRLEDLPGGTGVVFRLDEKMWGPNYFRIGLGWATNLAGNTDFNVKISHTRRWLNDTGAEWRSVLQLGSRPRLVSELIQPLGWHTDPRLDWFVAPHIRLDRQDLIAYQQPGYSAPVDRLAEIGHYLRNTARLGLDLAKPLSQWGELRFGVQQEKSSLSPSILSPELPDLSTQRASERAARMRLVMDQVDYTAFATRGFRLEAGVLSGQRWGDATIVSGATESVTRWDLDALSVHSRGRHTLNVSARLQGADQPMAQGIGYYNLGGFLNLSGYKPRQFSGNHVALGRLIYQYQMSEQPVLTRGFFAGGSLEAGNAWQRQEDISLGTLRLGSSLFLGADTGIGPLYLGLTYAPKGGPGVFIQLGRP
jgi:NTE family protein